MSRRMKDSGVEWIGEIPEDWEVVQLGRIGTFSASGIDKKTHDDEVPVKIINYTDVYGNKKMTIDASREYMEVSTTESKIKEHLVDVGDIIFTPSSETVDEIGISAVVLEAVENLSFSYHVLRYQPHLPIDNAFKKYLTNNHYLRSYFASLATGTIRKTLNRRDFKNARVLLPPSTKQMKISNFLDQKTATIDHIIEKTKESIEDYKLYKQSLISEAVTKGLNPDVKLKDSGVEWIGEIPEHWGLIKAKRLFEFSSGLTITKASLRDTGTAVVSYGQIHAKDNPGTHILDKHGRYIDESITRENSQVFINDFIFADTSEDYEGVGNFVLNTDVDELHAGYHTIIGRLKAQAHPSYIAYFMMSNMWRDQLRPMVSGVKVFSVSQKILGGSEYLLPPLAEQVEISNYLAGRCPQIDSSIQAKEQLIEDLETYKKSLIYEVVTGKREVG